MSAVHFVTQGDEGQLALLGELTFETVPRLGKELEPMFKQCSRLRIDLSGLERADSAGLALLIEWTRLARTLDHTLEFTNIPQQLLTIARASGLDRILPFLCAESGVDAGGRRITGDRL